MKKITIVGFMAILALISASSVQAETKPNPTPALRKEVRTEVKAAVQTKRDDMKAIASTTRADIKEKRVEMKGAASTTRQTLKNEIEQKKQELKTERASTTDEIKLIKINGVIKDSGLHLSAELSKLNDAKTRIDSRLAKFEQAGGNTTTARADLALAVTSLATAQTKIDAVSAVQASTDTKTFADALRTAVKDAQSAINDAQKALSKVTSDMRGLEASIKLPKTASSTQN
jgi:hypothetical protein